MHLEKLITDVTDCTFPFGFILFMEIFYIIMFIYGDEVARQMTDMDVFVESVPFFSLGQDSNA